jgi:hypothetical protein
MVADDDDATAEDVGPSTPPQAVHHHAAQPGSNNDVLALNGAGGLEMAGIAFNLAGVPVTKNGRPQLT